jgi:hypothetical protein
MHNPHLTFTSVSVKLTASVYATSDGARVTVVDGKPVCTCRDFAINNMMFWPECKHTEAVEAAVEAERTQPAPYRFLNTDTCEMEEIIDF